MEKKGEATKRRIREAAFALFSENGYTKVSMQDICNKTGLSKGGLYRHYEDKCQLFADLLYELQREAAVSEKNSFQQRKSATEIFDSYLEHIRQDLNRACPNINIALYEFCVEHKDGAGAEILSAQFQRGQTNLLSLLQYGISEGSFHTADPQGAVSAILFLVEGLRMVNEVMPITAETLDEVFGQIKKIAGLEA